MTPQPVRVSPPAAGKRRSRQQRFWSLRYEEDPAFFGRGASPFARWAAPWLRRHRVQRVLELGAGYGRDLRYLLENGYDARGVDNVRRGVSQGRASLSRFSPTPHAERRLTCGSAEACLAAQRPGSLDAVYSNLFLNMDYTEREHRRLLRAVHRSLRPGGLHLYSVRSVNDPWYGRGVRRGPATFDLAPHGTTMHFFSERYVRSLAGGRFEVLRVEERSEGGRSFPTKVLYVVERKGPSRPPRGSGGRPKEDIPARTGARP